MTITLQNPHSDHAIADIASRHHGSITHAQLRELGLSDRAIKSRCDRGFLHRQHPRVYFVGHRRSDHLALAAAAVRAVTGVGAASGRCAAALMGYYDRGAPITEVVSTARHRPLQGATVHWTRQLPDDEIMTWRGIQVTTPARTIVDLADSLTEYQVAFAIHEARRLRVLKLAELLRIAARHTSRHGAGTLARAIALHRSGSAGTRSHAEDAFVLRCVRAGIPLPQVNVRVPTGRGHVECDFYWDDILLNVEIDGGEHRLPARQRKDGIRDAKLMRTGVEVARFPPGFLDAAIELVQDRFARRGA